MKICRTCNSEKEDSAFYPNRRICKSCYCKPGPNTKEVRAAGYIRNRDQIKAQVKEYTENNRFQINLQRKQRYNSCPLHKLTQRLRCRLRDALAGKIKAAKAVELLGAPWVWVEAYLEEQFVPGMTWENHGSVWHIDHIRPCASFDFTDPEQQKMCFHWTNLQPLFALENLRKGDTYDPLKAI